MNDLRLRTTSKVEASTSYSRFVNMHVAVPRYLPYADKLRGTC